MKFTASRFRTFASAFLVASLAIFAGDAKSKAVNDVTVTRIPFTDELLLNTCTGEYILFNGQLHVFIRLNYDANGLEHWSYREQIVNTIGIGQDTGTIYRVVGNYQNPEAEYYWNTLYNDANYPNESGHAEIKHRLVTTLVVPVGKSDDRTHLFYRRHAKYYTDANGVMRVSSSQAELTCSH